MIWITILMLIAGAALIKLGAISVHGLGEDNLAEVGIAFAILASREISAFTDIEETNKPYLRRF